MKIKKAVLFLLMLFVFADIVSVPLQTASASSAPPQIKSLPGSRMVCLTFDDGYKESSIITILDCLRANRVRCTFFVIGSCLKRYPKLWQQAVADGHEIAYHTMTHGCLNDRSNRSIISDLERWNTLACEILGPGYMIPKIARAPGGRANPRVRKLFASLGYSLIYWSLDTFTGVYQSSHRNTAGRISTYIMNDARSGSIALQHFNNYDAPSVSLFIRALKSRFNLGKVSDAIMISDAYDHLYMKKERVNFALGRSLHPCLLM